MTRYKTLIGNRLSLRCHDAQVAEMLAGVKALNKMLSLGMPVRREITKLENKNHNKGLEDLFVQQRQQYHINLKYKSNLRFGLVKP